MKIKSIILPLFAVLFAVSPVAVADDRGDERHGENLVSYPLIHATFHNDIAEVKNLLDGGANPNAADNHGGTALIYTTNIEHVEIVKMLLAAGANPNAADKNGVTALHTVAWDRSPEFVKMLLSAGANPNMKRIDGYTALDFAEINKHTEVIAVLRNFRPSVSPEEYIAGLQAEYCGDIAAIECQENVAEANSEVDESASADECPLCDSAENGDIAEVKRLLDGGANPNAAKYDGWTALMYASFYGHAEIVKMLLSAGANPNAANFYNETALFNASKMIYAKSAEIMKMLLAAGANPNAADKDGWTALMIMAKKRHPEIVKMLLSAGADVNVANNGGWTALKIAEHYGHTEVISILQNFRPSISPEDIEFAPFDENNIDLQDEIIKDESEYAFRQFSAMSENEQAEFCISIRSPQKTMFLYNGNCLHEKLLHRQTELR